MLSAAGLSVLADGMAQAVERRGSWDVSRAAWISAWGASVSGLMLFFWFRLLARLFPLAASSTAQLVGKVALNQAVMSPGLNAGFFTFVVLTRDKAPPPAALTSATSCLVTTLLATYGLHRPCLVTSARTAPAPASASLAASALAVSALTAPPPSHTTATRSTATLTTHHPLLHLHHPSPPPPHPSRT